MTETPGHDYELLDFGNGRRLERFGRAILDRPAPGAGEPPSRPEAWAAADARYERGAGDAGRWVVSTPLPESWPVRLDGLTLGVVLAASGQVGVYPEHLAVARWVTGRGTSIAVSLGRPAKVLNLFAGTGLVTLALARAGAGVVHVDASRPTVARARANAGRSGLDQALVRWLVEDAGRFVARERRRARRYEGIVLDPPTYGHGPAGTPWALAAGLVDLLAGAGTLLEPGGFLALTAHQRDLRPATLAAAVSAALEGRAGSMTSEALDLRTADGRRLAAGAAVLADLP